MTKNYSLFKKHFLFKHISIFTFYEWEGFEWYIILTIALIIKYPTFPNSTKSKLSFSIEWLKGVLWFEITF